MYTFGIYIFRFILKSLSFFNEKIKKGVVGRRDTFAILEAAISKTDQTLWFHCASLGEYEQGLPVFELLRKDFPDHKIVLSFFSPSGYEIRKNSAIADVVVYLPIDTPVNAKRFMDLVRPSLSIFVKYDIWPNYLKALKKDHRSAVLISARFRKKQIYFQFYGSVLRKALFAFEHIFVQDEQSKQLLKAINYNQVSISGDTRYDRVSNQLQINNQLDFIAAFKAQSTCVVIGSSWPEDEAVLLPYINDNASEALKFIIAPHEIKKNHIRDILKNLKVKTLLFSEKEGKNLSEYSVLIIDSIGLLTKIYSYADLAYVGGAMGKTGLHNILEPAVFGTPIIIGHNHTKFPEAAAMIAEAAVTSVKNKHDLKTVLDRFLSSKPVMASEGKKNAHYIEAHSGAVEQIMAYLRLEGR
ncbi:3-deoxy-D-manno-octulosonic acid transferase [Subsaximicrobium wynnwilliamsii]|uniref:3-deoxy-D-manno-octulosonic acid transferase n=1 Tax=Subsaximicrobium wynnwilliamsii TaxID=291179 RepID=A0A5C6ZLG6_9FLAO|nr:glycosyltransferase N-terminal domain-containing protein [Subsaximicrobium wynnwilliamsii]TXD85516.1 3-deoxy-D-manno-octulosonic acid transferase [Subsaximicrobium wynnwilliamsii]TXD90869.1 3-deoxy-D-manno-octulosonic acid transferase [Subsaximicrobium wynnwilliamsii]TXE05376.1 3-deoxy-D-manno-octulosonic acid transferase [Subsaximicrobium wynnwilliamsii]